MKDETDRRVLTCCNQGKAAAEDAAVVRHAKLLAANRGCNTHRLDVVCKRCTGPCEGADGVLLGNIVFLCTNGRFPAGAAAFPNEAAGLVAHEIVHFSQFCGRQRPPFFQETSNNCLSFLMAEMEAYMMSYIGEMGVMIDNSRASPTIVRDIGRWIDVVFSDLLRRAAKSACGMQQCTADDLRAIDYRGLVEWFTKYNWKPIAPGLEWQPFPWPDEAATPAPR